MNFDNTNRGVLFPNDKKGNEKRPDFTGDLNVGGVEYRLSAWKKASKQGNNFLSISVQLKEGQKIPPKTGFHQASQKPLKCFEPSLPNVGMASNFVSM